MGEMCRLCLSEKDVLIPIFYRGSDLPDHIKACLAVQVSTDDYHKHICITCDGKLRYWWSFKLEIQSAQKFLNNQFSKTLYSRAVTSSAENQSPSDDVSKVGASNTPGHSTIRVKNYHTLAPGTEFGDNQGLSPLAGGPTAVIIKQEPSDSLGNSTSGRGLMQVVPISAARNGAYYQNSHVDVSSSSGGNNFGRELVASSSKNTANHRSSGQPNSQTDVDECTIVDVPQKRSCPSVDLEDSAAKKRQKIAPVPKKSNVKKIAPLERKKPGPKPNSTKNTQQVVDTRNGTKCRYCTSVFYSQKDLTTHLKRHTLMRIMGKQNIPCPYCSNTLLVCSLSHHVRNVHKMDPDAAGLQSYIENKMSKLKNHSDVKVNGMKIVVFSCNLCKNSYKTLFALKMHKKRFHTNGGSSNMKGMKHVCLTCVCDHCNRQLISRAALASHKQYCGTSHASVCPFCSMQFESVMRLKRHISDKHSGGGGGSEVETELAPKMEVDVKESSELVPNRDNIETSPWKRRPNCPQCSQCTRKFIVEEKLNDHMKYCGTIQGFKCTLCPQQFASSRSATFHSKKIHNRIVYPCDFCNQKFSSKIDVENHRKIHRQLLKTKMFHKCRSCQNVYNGVASFLNHKQNCKAIFTSKCGKCFLRFKDPDSLDKHVPQCTGKSRLEEKMKLNLKSIKCLQCMSKFAGENDFINHFVESHVNAANSIFSGVNSFDCHFCFYAANNPNSVKNHTGHCRGISFYVVKSAVVKTAVVKSTVVKSTGVKSTVDKQRPSVIKSSSSVGPKTSKTKPGVGQSSSRKPSVQTKKPKSLKLTVTSTGPKQSDTNEEITKICSPAFMNEHLNASKNAQVLVKKLSDNVINNVSNSKESEESTRKGLVSSESSSVVRTESTKKRPADKLRCEFCLRYYTPSKISTHRCQHKKRILHKRAIEARSKKDTKKEETDTTNLIKCELCYDMVAQKVLPEHLKNSHQAVKPAEMARSMIELNLMRQTLNTHVIKEEALEKSEAEEDAASSGHGESDNDVDSPCINEPPINETDNEDMDTEATNDENAENIHASLSNSGEEPEEDIEEELAEDIEEEPVEDIEEELAEDLEEEPTEDLEEEPEDDLEEPEDLEEEPVEESVKTRCDMCLALFTLPDLEIHLKNVHHAVNPAAMARTMMENNLSFSKITVNFKSENDSDTEDEKNSSHSNSPNSEDMSVGEGEEGNQNLDSPAPETNTSESHSLVESGDKNETTHLGTSSKSSTSEAKLATTDGN